jgi:hypothetical protein
MTAAILRFMAPHLQQKRTLGMTPYPVLNVRRITLARQYAVSRQFRPVDRFYRPPAVFQGLQADY